MNGMGRFAFEAAHVCAPSMAAAVTRVGPGGLSALLSKLRQLKTHSDAATPPKRSAPAHPNDRPTGAEVSRQSGIQHLGSPSCRAAIRPDRRDPVVAVEYDDSLLVALPYGEGTDWLKNVLASGSAADARTYGVDQPEVIPIAEGTAFFRPREQGMHRRFRVDSALRLRRI